LRSKYYDKKGRRKSIGGNDDVTDKGALPAIDENLITDKAFLCSTQSPFQIFDSSSSLMIIYKFIKNILVLFSSED
jgi:hypothetical protein